MDLPCLYNHHQAKGADSERSGGGGRKRSHANITSSSDNGKRPAGGARAPPPPPPAAAPPAFGQGVLTLADFEHKRQRRTRPLDLDRPMPVIVAGRADEKSTIRCVDWIACCFFSCLCLTTPLAPELIDVSYQLVTQGAAHHAGPTGGGRADGAVLTLRRRAAGIS